MCTEAIGTLLAVKSSCLTSLDQLRPAKNVRQAQSGLPGCQLDPIVRHGVRSKNHGFNCSYVPWPIETAANPSEKLFATVYIASIMNFPDLSI